MKAALLEPERGEKSNKGRIKAWKRRHQIGKLLVRRGVQRLLLNHNPLINNARARFYCHGRVFRLYLPEDAEDHDSRDQGHEGDAVADGVADLHLPEEFALSRQQQRQGRMLVQFEVGVSKDAKETVTRFGKDNNPPKWNSLERRRGREALTDRGNTDKDRKDKKIETVPATGGVGSSSCRCPGIPTLLAALHT